MRDDDVRAAMFAALAVLQARCGPDVPWPELAQGFAFRGRRIPFLNRACGIHRAREQRGPAALSINSSLALRQAHLLQTPLVYCIGTRPGWYRPEYPVWIAEDHPAERRVPVTFGKMVGPHDEREPVPISAEIERRYAVSQVRRRIHRARFAGRWSRRTPTRARSAASRRSACSTPRTSSPTATRPARRW